MGFTKLRQYESKTVSQVARGKYLNHKLFCKIILNKTQSLFFENGIAFGDPAVPAVVLWIDVFIEKLF